MAAVNRNQITAGILAALQNIDGTGDYVNDLTAPGQIENVQWSGPPESVRIPYVSFWLGARSDIRDGQDADLSQYGQTMRFFIVGMVGTSGNPAEDVARANDLEADIIRALHANRRLPVSGVGTVFDLAVDTQVLTGEDVATGAEGAYVDLGGELYWARL